MIYPSKKIKKGDVVMASAGKDKGKTGKVLMVFPKESKALVEGINFVKKAMRRKSQESQGGIIQKESPIDISNLAIFCKNCNRPARVGLTTLSDGAKSRLCKRCKEIIG